MAISKANALSFFQGLTRGSGFYAQVSDGSILFCQFEELTEFGNSGVVKYGVHIFPISQDFETRWLNLESIQNGSLLIDFKQELTDLVYP